MRNPLILSDKQKEITIKIRDHYCKYIWETGYTYEIGMNEVLPRRTIDSLINKGILKFKTNYPLNGQDSWILNPDFETFINSL